MTLAVMTGPEDGELNLCEYGGVEYGEVDGMDGDASGKKYGESDAEGVAGKLAGFWFGVCGAKKDLKLGR